MITVYYKSEENSKPFLETVANQYRTFLKSNIIGFWEGPNECDKINTDNHI